MHWILQGNIFKEEAFDRLVNTLQRFNITYSQHRVIPFIGELIAMDNQEPSDFSWLEGRRVICMGSYSMRHAAKKHGWTPGVFDLEEAGSYERCIAYWGKHMLNYGSVVLPFKDVRWAAGEVKFIRPTNDSKYFAGAVMEADEFNEWQTNVCVMKLDFGNSLTPETKVQIAPLRDIYTEFRCWVVMGEIATMSLYKRGSKVMYENMDSPLGDEARDYAKARIAEWQPHECFVIDVCQTSEGWRIVEVNTLNSCGFYAADLQKLVIALENAYAT